MKSFVTSLSTIVLILSFAESSAQEDGIRVSQNDEQINIVTPKLEAAIRKKGYVSGVAGGSFIDRKTGFRDVGFGLDIVDWIMEPGSDEAYRDELTERMVYQFGNPYHGKQPKRMIEGPQICTQAREVPTEIIRGKDFVAVKMWYSYNVAPPGRKTGSKWTQTIVFPEGKRYFVSSDHIDAVNTSDAMFQRIDMPGHIKHNKGDTFSEVYLSYPTTSPAPDILGKPGTYSIKRNKDGQRISSSAFFSNFAPDQALNYRREHFKDRIPKRFIRAYRLRDKETGKQGPWLAGMTLDPGVVYEAWCHQRGYICMIQEFGGRRVKAGESFSAAFIVGYFDSIKEMHEVYDQYAGHTDLMADKQGWKLVK